MNAPESYPELKKEGGGSFGLCCGGNSHQASNAGPDMDETDFKGVRHLQNHTMIELKKMLLVPYTGKKPLIHL